ncbi:tryptophan 2,3-dioxygenase family protein [Streptomyces sp. NBC_01264]|uniref:tryptophan 2,3-dioxygenase family protein n=1 Tax=Streptomyces sp. NBC_01264 TaxID=2903804 RepID=UPI00224D0816|nr:tryptophan 2,3-dioxygenase family protein [Streptomyces sp. NBC_01264]MCX4776556.1 tryptophan 2,3-dioxygenase family protein [Streptomyces sp. NBC_01264]
MSTNPEIDTLACARKIAGGSACALRDTCGSRAANLREINRWATAERIPEESDGFSLARSITEHVRLKGKHLLSDRTLVRLSDIKRRHGTNRPFLSAFLDCVLDKHEGRFQNRTYLALPVLELLMDERHAGLSADRMASLLMADVVRFEIEAAAGPLEGPGRDRPDEATLNTRLRHALRLVTTGPGQSESDDLPSRREHVPRSRLEGLADRLPRPPATDCARWFDVTVQPVHVVHDEYFFIRVLQTHEMYFTAMAAVAKKVIGALRAGNPEAAAELVDRAVVMFERAATLFRVVATMRPEQFSAFRQYTQGASAIQSEQYKRFESLCGVPPVPRLRSSAFTSVPFVRAETEDPGHDTITRACLDLRNEGGFDRARWNRLDRAIGRLENGHQRWKSAHRGLAARMLGDAHGSGYTDGVPYLTQCLGNRLFWQLDTSP